MVKPITLNKAMRILAGKDEPSVVDEVIEMVNQAFTNKYTMGHRRCGENMGHFYSVQTTPRRDVSLQDCLEIEDRFRAAGWKDVSVIFWQVSLTVQLECNASRGWKSHYNGKPIRELLASAQNVNVATM